MDEIAESISTTLESRSLKRCSRWAEHARHLISGPWTFANHPWLSAPHDDNTPTIVVQKAAQMGFTEYSMNRTLFTLDQLKLNVLYALPNERPDAANFSRGRLNAAAALSPYIEDLFTHGKNEGHKITKDYCNLYIRGARSRICFKQIDVALVVLDELDEMSDEAVELARYRLAGQKGFKQLIMVSTPSFEGRGIHKQFQDSSQAEFFFRCPHCFKHVLLSYPESLVITAETITDPRVRDSHLICPKCRRTLLHEAKPDFLASGEWVHAYPDRPIHGYHINQFYSCALHPYELAQQELRGRFNIQSKIEFFNSSLGLTFTPEGSRLTEQNLNDCQEDYLIGDPTQKQNRLVTIGADIGQENHHYMVVGWQFDPNLSTRDITIAAVGRVLDLGTVHTLAELDDKMHQWEPRRVVIDAQPETREAKTFCKRWQGLANMCYYSLKRAERVIVEGNVSDQSISVNRTFWLDTCLGKIRSRQLTLPKDLPLEARAHLLCLNKAYSVDDKGSVTAEYIKRQGDADHYAHALNYATIAMGMTAGHGANEET